MSSQGTLATTQLQKIDRLFGIPACFLFTQLRSLLGENIPSATEPIGKLLFIKLAEQGSTVLAHSAIKHAVSLVGRENVYFVVFAENRFILDLLDLIPRENVFTIQAHSFAALVSSTWKVLGDIRRMRFDAAIDLEFFARSSAAFTFLTAARRRVGFHTFYGEGPYRGDLMTHRLLYNPYLHTSQIFAQMVESLRVDPAQLPTFGALPPPAEAEDAVFCPTPEETAAVRTILQRETRAGSADAPLILLNANASDLLPLRRWDPQRYVELARLLLNAFPEAQVLMTGAPAEAAAADRLVQQVGSDRCFSVAGKTTLRQLLVLYTLAEVLVTNDSGPAHFASLTPINVVTLFGPETPRLFGARTDRNVAIWRGIACSPCVNAYNNRQTPCRNNLCMQQITVEEVFAAARDTYSERRASVALPDATLAES